MVSIHCKNVTIADGEKHYESFRRNHIISTSNIIIIINLLILYSLTHSLTNL